MDFKRNRWLNPYNRGYKGLNPYYKGYNPVLHFKPRITWFKMYKSRFNPYNRGL